ncbi:hypothetical protein BFP72_05800 [Reichenbachiella sp. 5M10]|uniref:STAS domain-containing protein n=1 Tax=Reichenbachiella sp. 5M10 TaxID=1889772 RepID=UPI000C158CFC|nr:STAS domain-containing protein [Reichenbachiella sp. 5M10]PIB34941.1 hypothetical protein BFP72_05800 [Reichenbachiella sp. 5M10]
MATAESEIPNPQVPEAVSPIKIVLEPIKNNDDGITIYLEGQLTINHVEEIQRKVELAMSQFGTVRIVLQAVEMIDLSVVQLFFYLTRLAIEDDNDLSFEHDLSETSTTRIVDAGLAIYPNLA